MSLEVLLPGGWKTDGFAAGANGVRSNDFSMRLFDPSDIHHAGVPSLFARAFAFRKALEIRPCNEVARERFAMLVQALFLGIIQVRSHALGGEHKIDETIRKFEPGMRDFHALVWKGRPIGALHPDCMFFPGAKFVKASDWSQPGEDGLRAPKGRSPESEYVDYDAQSGVWNQDLSFHSLRVEIATRLQCYGEDWVKALFQLWLDRIADPDGTGMDGNITGALWYRLLLDLANNELQTTVTAPATAFDMFAKSTLVPELSGANGKLVKIPLFTVTDSPFSTRIIRVAPGKLPDLPIRSEYLDLVDPDKCSSTAREAKYLVSFKGWSAPVSWRARDENIVNCGGASILLWPSWRAEGWKVNYVDVAFSTVNAEYKPSVRLLDDSCKPIDSLDNMHGGNTSVPVGFVEVILADDKQIRQGAGVFRDNRNQLSEHVGPSVTVSLDLGTTNTTVGIWDGRSGRYASLAMEGYPADLLETGYWWSSNDDDMADRRSGSYFLPIASSMGKGDRIDSLPSELVFVDHGSRQGGGKLLDRAVSSYTIPHPNFQRERAYTMMVGNFKWEAPEGYDRWQLIRAYSRLVLQMVVAQLREQELATKVEVVPTYPLAFGAGDYGKFYELLVGGGVQQGLLDEIAAETGVALNLPLVNATQRVPVAESYAARESIAWSPKPGETDLVVDIGGGSTDIAAWIDGVEYSESLPYGGNVYLKYIAKKFKSSLPIKDAVKNEEIDNVIALQTIVRKHGIDGVLTGFSQQETEATQIAIDRFFNGVFVYLYRLIRMGEAHSLNFYPLGNGWRLIGSYAPPYNDISAYIKARLEHWGINATIVLPDGDDFKGAVCRGARRVVDTGTYTHPENIDINTIVGGNIVINGNRLEWNSHVPTAGLGRPPLAFDCEEFVRDFADDASIALGGQALKLKAGKLAAACMSATRDIPGGQVGLNRSVMAVFLEKVYPEMMLE